MGKILAKSTVYSQFKIYIPVRVREKLKIKVGDVLVWIDEGGKIVVKSEME